MTWREWDTGDYADELLATLDPPRAATLVWYLRDLEIVGAGLRGMSVPALEEAVAAEPYGLRVSWEELLQLIRSALDIHDLLATGHPTTVSMTLDSTAGSYPGCSAAIEVFDSGPFRVGWDSGSP